MGSDRPIDRVLDALRAWSGTTVDWMAFCPAHEDQNTPNLSITQKEDGKVLVYCFVCKDQEKVLRALEERGIRRSDPLLRERQRS